MSPPFPLKPVGALRLFSTAAVSSIPLSCSSSGRRKRSPGWAIERIWYFVPSLGRLGQYDHIAARGGQSGQPTLRDGQTVFQGCEICRSNVDFISAVARPRQFLDTRKLAGCHTRADRPQTGRRPGQGRNNNGPLGPLVPVQPEQSRKLFTNVVKSAADV
jgi:hypothetical protein